PAAATRRRAWRGAHRARDGSERLRVQAEYRPPPGGLPPRTGTRRAAKAARRARARGPVRNDRAQQPPEGARGLRHVAPARRCRGGAQVTVERAEEPAEGAARRVTGSGCDMLPVNAPSASRPPALSAQPERDRFRQAPRRPAGAAADDAEAPRFSGRAPL